MGLRLRVSLTRLPAHWQTYWHSLRAPAWSSSYGQTHGLKILFNLCWSASVEHHASPWPDHDDRMILIGWKAIKQLNVIGSAQTYESQWFFISIWHQSQYQSVQEHSVREILTKLNKTDMVKVPCSCCPVEGGRRHVHTVTVVCNTEGNSVIIWRFPWNLGWFQTA